MSNNKISSIVKLIAGSVIISFSPFWVKASGVEPDIAGLYRNLFGGMIFFFIIVLRQILLNKKVLTIEEPVESFKIINFFFKFKKKYLLPVLAGTFFFLDLLVWHISILYIGGGLATLLGNLQIFFVAAFAILFMNEKINLKIIASIPIALIGLYLITASGVSLSGNRLFITGIILGVLTSIFYAGFLIILKQAQNRNNDVFFNMAIVSLTTSLIFLFYITIFENGSFTIYGKALFMMFCYGTFSQFFGWYLITSSIKHVKSVVSSMILLLQPVFAYVWDITIFGRNPSTMEIIGSLLAITAIFIGSNAAKANHKIVNKSSC